MDSYRIGERKEAQRCMKKVPNPGVITILRRRISLTFGVLLIGITVGGAINACSDGYLDTIGVQGNALNSAVDTMLNGMINQETGIRGYLFTANPIFLDPYYMGQREYGSAQENLRRLLQQSKFLEGQQLLSRVDLSAQKWMNAYASVRLRLTKARGAVLPDQVHVALQGKQLFDTFRAQLRQLRAVVGQYIAAQKTLAYQLAWGSFATTVLLSLLLTIASWWLFRKSTFELARQFIALRTTADRLTQGDLQARAPTEGYDELVQVGRAINHMVDSLQQKQEVLGESEQQFRLLAESIPHLVMVVEAGGAIQYCNQRWYDYTGLTCQQNQAWIELAHPEDRKRCWEQWREALTTGSFMEMELRLRRVADQAYRWNLLQALPVMNQDGQASKWFVTVTDIEDRNQMKSLAEINQRQRVFVSTVSHEFRTSLTSIQGFSQLLAEEELSMGEMKDFAHDISEESLRLHRMIDDVLDLEKMREGKMPLHKERIEINTLLRDAIEHMQAISKKHVLRCQLDERLPSIEADRDKLQRVVNNLLSNAIKYSLEGGEILVKSVNEGKQLHISVRDHGMGISPDALQHIFTPFNRGDAENMTGVRGTGLGLPIVEQIVIHHGGKIWVESVLGLGSIFHFTLPLTPDTAAPEGEAPRAVPASVRGTHTA